jgi:tetratricopeptide (TPR) repeat protein
MKNYIDSVQDATKGIELNKGFCFYVTRGSAYYHLNMLDEALSDFNECLKLNPRNSRALNNRAWIYFKKRKYKLSILDYYQALKINPKYLKTYISSPRVYKALKECIYEIILSKNK